MQAFQLVATSAALIDAATNHSSWVRGVQRTLCKGQLEKVLSSPTASTEDDASDWGRGPDAGPAAPRTS